MEVFERILFGFLMVLFGIGALGCAITIPLAAARFFAVLFEKGETDQHRDTEFTPVSPK
ncbi:MAG TPA: hypothetical protein VN577_11875 [Terriglobales bacterium]|nr:hypothetical protein [Terriglobales bacterium]